MTATQSLITPKQIQEVYDSVQETYRSYPHPWVIGYSGGKDSTTALQIVWNALAQLPAEERTKPVYVISSDTLVETPVIVDYITRTLRQINECAAKEELPFIAEKLTPALTDKFWVNLIGRGYPAPSSVFRWCTERLKIQPSNRFILNKVAEYGEVILVLGVRRGESSTRDQVINMHRITGYQLAKHSHLPGAWVYMPIENFTTDDVWTYLLQTKSPWGGDNRQLASLYQSAQAGECPLVIDTSTPSCGNSRFGCWVCTVVNKDKSMEAMIDSGQEWMIPFLEFRDWLASTQDPDVKPMQREFKSRDGRIKFKAKGDIVYRTYTLEFSKEMLKRLLQTQVDVQRANPAYQLINEDEIHEIRRIWLTERQDWEDSVPQIYEEAIGKTLNWQINDVKRPGALEAEILEHVASDYDVPVRLLQKLLDTEWQHFGMRRRGSIHLTIERVLREDWRTLEEVNVEAARLREKAESSE